jgi:hypothetical protein
MPLQVPCRVCVCVCVCVCVRRSKSLPSLRKRDRTLVVTVSAQSLCSFSLCSDVRDRTFNRNVAAVSLFRALQRAMRYFVMFARHSAALADGSATLMDASIAVHELGTHLVQPIIRAVTFDSHGEVVSVNPQLSAANFDECNAVCSRVMNSLCVPVGLLVRKGLVPGNTLR